MHNITSVFEPQKASEIWLEKLIEVINWAGGKACGYSSGAINRSKPWWDNDCAEKHEEWNIRKTLAERSQDPAQLHEFKRGINREWVAMRRQKIRNFYKKEVYEAVKLFTKNIPRWWQEIPGLKKKARKQILATFVNGIAGRVTNKASEMAEAFARHYAKLGRDVTKPHFNDRHYEKIQKKLSEFKDNFDEDSWDNMKSLCCKVTLLHR